MGLDVGFMLVVYDWSKVCYFFPLHKRLAIGYKTRMRVRFSKFLFCILNPPLLILRLYLLRLANYLQISLGISQYTLVYLYSEPRVLLSIESAKLCILGIFSLMASLRGCSYSYLEMSLLG